MSRNSARPAQKFVSRLVAGCVLAILFGFNVDEYFNTSPWIMLVLLLYVMIGSLYLLIRETRE